jgi:type I restriction enzyme, S subunit
MIRKRYLNYKSSGIEWLGDVPEHWEVLRTRYLLRMNPGKNEISNLDQNIEVDFIPMESVGEDGSIKLEHKKPIEDVIGGYTYFAEGDVTFAKITPCFENGKGGIMRNLQSNFGFGTTELTVLRINSTLSRDYLYYITISREFRKNGEAWMYGAGGQKRVPDDFVKEFKFCYPPLIEQDAIVAFLDRETNRIDRLIDKKKKLIELLKEKRTTMISRAVTKGLDTSAKLKPSEVEWLGDVPEHWEVNRLKYQTSINDDTLPEDTDPDFEILYVDIGSVSPAEGIVKKEKFLFEDAPSRARRIVKNGDTIVSTVRTYLRAIASIINPEDNLVVSTGFAVIRPKNIFAGYLSYVLNAPYFIEEVVSRSVGVSYPAIKASMIGEIFIPIPSFTEQQRISNFLDAETVKIDNLVSKVEVAIERLKEYRITLISSAVTGKIDVRDIQ